MPKITLPNGVVVEVPEDATPELVREYAIDTGLATSEDFDKQFNAFQFVKENLDIPLGLGGALGGAATGAAIGSAVPGIGTVIGGIAGGILGGAFGTGAGVVMSDVIEDPEDIDYAEALYQAGLSIGIDILTLGVGSKIKNMVKTAKALKYTPEEAAKIIADQAKIGSAAGSEESLAATQQFLSERGATLLPSQTGKASETVEQLESLAQFGILSGAQLDKNTRNVANAIKDSLTETLNRQGDDLFMSPEELGENMMKVIDNGKQSLSDIYSFSLDQINDRINGQITGSSTGIKKILSDFLTSRKDELNLNLDPETVQYVRGELTALGQNKRITLKALINLEKRLNKKITSASQPTSKGYNNEVSQELNDLSSSLKNVIENTIQKVDPEVSDIYKSAKKAYSEGIQGLLPDINSQYIRKARKGDYEALGSFLIHSGSANKINQFMKSIDTAFDVATGAAMTGKGVKAVKEGVGFESASQAKEAIKQGFIKNLFGDLNGDFVMNPKMAKAYEKPKMSAKLAAVLGKDAKQVKQLMNVMAETSTKQGSGFMGLSLAGRQVGAITGVGATALGGLGGLAGSLGTAGAILLTPMLISMKYTDPKWVNKLIALEKTPWESISARNIALSNFLADTVAALSLEDQAALREDIRKRSQEQPLQMAN